MTWQIKLKQLFYLPNHTDSCKTKPRTAAPAYDRQILCYIVIVLFRLTVLCKLHDLSAGA